MGKRSRAGCGRILRTYTRGKSLIRSWASFAVHTVEQSKMASGGGVESWNTYILAEHARSLDIHSRSLVAAVVVL